MSKIDSRTNPHEEFHVISYTRSYIADMLNMQIDTHDMNWIDEFTADDPRLTRAVCESFVEEVLNTGNDAWSETVEPDSVTNAADVILDTVFGNSG